MLGRHVGNRADHAAGVGQTHIARKLGQPEVDNLHSAIGQQHDVGRLDVAMHHAHAVRLRQAQRDLLGNVDCLLQRQRAALQADAQILARAKAHDDVELALGRLAKFVDGADVGVVEQRSGARFTLKARALLWIESDLARDELDRHRPVEL